MNRIFDVMALTAVVAGISAVVASSNSAAIINAFGDAWSHALLAAQGHGQ